MLHKIGTCILQFRILYITSDLKVLQLRLDVNYITKKKSLLRKISTLEESRFLYSLRSRVTGDPCKINPSRIFETSLLRIWPLNLASIEIAHLCVLRGAEVIHTSTKSFLFFHIIERSLYTFK